MCNIGKGLFCKLSKCKKCISAHFVYVKRFIKIRRILNTCKMYFQISGFFTLMAGGGGVTKMSRIIEIQSFIRTQDSSRILCLK